MQVILTHEHADFDAVASQVGLARLVPDAVVVLPQQVNGNVVDFLTLYGRELPVRRRHELPRGTITHLWLVDTRQVQPLRGVPRNVARTIIDHHVTRLDDAELGATVDVQPVGATSTLITERLAAAGVEPTPIEATLLLLGIYEDTGSLTYSQTTPRDARAAAALIELGADLDLAARFLRYHLSAAGRMLLQQLLAAAETHVVAGHPVLIATAEARDFDEEVSTLATKLADLLEPVALFVIVDVGPYIQVVARSTTDAINVGAVAEAVGGGGHDRAAAAVLRDRPLGDARAQVLDHLPAAVRPAVTVSEIMSRGPIRSLAPDQTIAAALELATLYGHEGYPVLDGDEVLGLVARHALDRAVRHGLGAEPVRRLLSGRPPAIRPDDSVEALQQVMMSHDVGQVPVVDGGRVAGIVTRTDLLSLWSRRSRQRSQATPHVDLDAVLAAPALGAIRHIAGVANERQDRVFLVGGLPRDLVLGIPAGPDIDVVVEGDAADLARAVAERHGGRVRAHRRFGTAKWLGPDGAVDLVSARAEYYAAPTALPQVERGSLHSDLRRRDFAINALAIDLSSERFGQVIDYFGGLEDLRSRRIRVLHSLSFIDDPTRIIRAVRLATRLGFEIEGRTAELIPEAIGLIERVSGARLMNELWQLFAEPDPVAGLRLLAELGVLSAIHPELGIGTRTRGLLDLLPAAWSFWLGAAAALPLDRGPAREHGALLWLAELGAGGPAAGRRLSLPAKWMKRLAAIQALWAAPSELSRPSVPDSRVHELLCGHEPEVLLLGWIGTDQPEVRRKLLRFATTIAGVQIEVDGRDLAEMGLPQGPVYRRILSAVRRARLDGEVATREEQLAMMRRLALDVEGAE